MPFDHAGFRTVRQRTRQEQSDLNVLKTAREQVIQGNWCKGDMQRFDGARCAIGWLIRFQKNVRQTDRIVESWAAMLPSLPGAAMIPPLPIITHGWSLVMLYNDANDTGQPDIVALYDQSIAKIETETVSVPSWWQRLASQWGYDGRTSKL